MFIHDAHGLTLAQTKNMYLNESCYWDQDDASRKWARRYFGQMMQLQYPYQVKAPADSKSAWDYYKLLRTAPAEEAFTKRAESSCKLWK